MKKFLRASTATSIALLLTSLAYAAWSDVATLELQSRFPVCSEVLKAKADHQDPPDEDAPEVLQGEELRPLLNQYKRQGADLNAYFRLGTPLHHAICAGWNAEVRWLLRNGANPLLEVEGASATDALGVAVRTENWDAATTLLKHYQRLLKTPGIAEKQQALIHASVENVTHHQSEADEKIQQYQRLLKKIGWNPSPKVWGEKYGQLLCSGQVKAALDIVKAQPWGKNPPTEVSDATWTCPAYYAGRPTPKILPTVADMPSWRSLDALLPNPVLLPLVPLLANGRAQDTLQMATAQGLRAPWSSQDLATIYFQAVLSRRDALIGEEPSLMRLIPPAQLQRVLTAPQTRPRFNFTPYSYPLGGIALLRTGTWPLPDLEWLLAQLDSGTIEAAQDDFIQLKTTASAAHWEKLTPRLVAPLSIPYGYPKSLPYALWPKWKALGAVPAQEPTISYGRPAYTWSDLLASIPMAQLAQGLEAARQLKEASPQSWPTDADWGRLLLRTKPNELPDFLAMVKVQRPDLLPRVMDWALAPLSFGTTADPVALELTPNSLSRMEMGTDEKWERVRRLAALGFKARQPRYPLQDLSNASAPVPTMEEAIANDWAIAPAPTAKPTDTTDPASIQWTKPQLSCHKKVDDGLRLALVKDGEDRRANASQDQTAYLLPVQVQGLNDCQWLLVGGRFPGRVSWTDYDFFEGEELRWANAGDGNRYALFWNGTKNQWVESGVTPNSGDAMLIHQLGQTAPWVAISGRVDWGQYPNDIFQARLAPDNTVDLQVLPTDHPGRINLIQECGGELMLDGCQALGDVIQNDAVISIAQFADTYWPQARQDFLDTLLRNDRAALNGMREAGLFSHWLSAGLRALGEADSLSLAEKRQRAAWILALNQPSADYDEATLNSLLPWLPPEDWRPIVKRLGCYPRSKLLEKATEKKDFSLSTRLQHEMNRFTCPSE